jgi:LysR family glycine cleavage system transcriptional activator
LTKEPERLPPLTALRAFEAAARHLSFARAAAELNVTPAALSFQIKSLEEHLGEPLFRRLNRAVELTEAGRLLAPGAQEGFAALGMAWRAARRRARTGALSITAGPAFTAKWLAPRLFAFAEEHPDIELRFAATLRILDFERDDVDVAIRFGYGPDEGLHAEPLFDEWVTPMMSPDLARRYPQPEALAGATLLHDDSIAFLDPPCDWPAWFSAAGVARNGSTGLRFSQADHALDAAQAGTGVVMGRLTLAAKDLQAGRLVAPYALGLRTNANFRFVCQHGALERPQVRAFRDWILAESAKLGDLAEGRDLRGASAEGRVRRPTGG